MQNSRRYGLGASLIAAVVGLAFLPFMVHGDARREDSIATAENQVITNGYLATLAGGAPSGAGATAAKQDTGNTSLGNLDTDQGAKADSAATDSTSAWSEIALGKGQYNRLAAIATSLSGTLTTRPVSAALGSATATSCSTATSTQALAADSSRTFLFIQNNSGTDYAISVTGATVSGMTTTNANPVFILHPGGDNRTWNGTYCPTGAVTVRQESGSANDGLYVESK